MTDTEDDLFSRLSGSALLLAVWQFMAGACCVNLAVSGHPLFWWPAGVTVLAFVLSLVELLWYIPRLRHIAFLRGYGWRVSDACDLWTCNRCGADVEDGRCSCETSPSPWVVRDNTVVPDRPTHPSRTYD